MSSMGNLRRRTKWKGAVISIITAGIIGLWLFNMILKRDDLENMHRPTSKSGSRPAVTLRQGKIIGVEVEDGYPQVLEQFLGIPYGLSTSGQGRFKPPLPVNASGEEFDASHLGYRCPAGPRDQAPQSEDCLNLNLYRWKIRDPGQKLPVLVHIHGGAFNFGPGDSGKQISHLVAWSAEPMLAISFNYRVGAFGFLPSKTMAREGLLNVGLKDQRLLLEWVQKNIAEFGGDPDDVTLMGSSAGAHSIGHHLFYEVDKPPLFNKVIIESGAATARAVYTYSNPIHEKQFLDFLAHLGVDDVSEKEIVSTLRQFTTSQIKAASEAIYNKYNPSVRWPFQPVIDGKKGFISTRPIDAWKSGKWHKVPILTGFNTNEGAMFVPANADTGAQFTDFFHTLLPGLWDSDLRELNELYPDPVKDPQSIYKETRPGLGKQFSRLEQAYGQFAYIAPVRQTANYASDGPAPVYLYQFAASSSVKGRADHGNHSPFVSYNPALRKVSDTVNEISGTMHAYWTSFITSGDPNKIGGRYPERRKWPAYNKEEGRMLVFGEGNDEVAGGKNKGVVVQLKDDGYAKEECGFWWKRTELFEF